VSLRRLPGRYELATTQAHHGMHGRAPVRRADLAEYLADPQRVVGSGEQHESLYPPYRYAGHAWAMFINLNTCIGCSACTIACQAENNIPVVGKEEVRRGREMHWIRVDRYYEGETHDPRTYFQPVPCMHCEHAPCELVCPVGATMHDGEGLNVQVYNRCIGTRFCSNNCPYKVRRFNFLQYADRTTEALAARRNPQVTVRRRGVMEKCTYCIQRIERARIRAEREDRALRDGEVLTACQQVCPTQAIVFGDLNDRKSALVQAKASPLNYVLLEELNTRPRTSYGARLRNPNADLSADNGENA
jgi:Fe-S-cluster-containing dehydrogenase component